MHERRIEGSFPPTTYSSPNFADTNTASCLPMVCFERLRHLIRLLIKNRYPIFGFPRIFSSSHSIAINCNEEDNALSKSEATSAGTRLNRLGAVASLACAAHCAAMPLLIGLLPILGLSFLAHEQTEIVLAGLSIGIGIFSLIPSYARKHRQWRPLLLFVSGASLIIAVKLLTEEGSHLEAPAMMFGALLIACAHIINRRLCRSCAACHQAGE
jgi:hypothetical protein